MATTNEKKELWVQWAKDAVAQFPMPEVDSDSSEDIANDMVDIATSYADLMLEEFEDRFETTQKTAKKRSKRRKADDEDEE